MAWSRLIRFIDDNDRTVFGEPCIENASELNAKLETGDLFAKELKGDDLFNLSAPGEKIHVKKLAGVLTSEDVPIVKCIGLNYMKHSKNQRIAAYHLIDLTIVK